MRLVQVSVPTGKRDAVLDELEEAGVDYVVSSETSERHDFTALVSFPLPTNAVEPVLDRLRKVGIEDDAYTVVLAAETVVSSRFDELAEEYSEDQNEDRIAREELRSDAEDLALQTRTYTIMTVVSAVVATAGLLLDSPATVVGSMVIAPLIGPAMAASVGTVIDDRELSRRGVKLQVVGIVLSVVSAALFALFLRVTNLVPPGMDPTASGEVAERLAPDFLSLAVALGAGIAGAVSLSAGVSSAIVGVMIAVALIPPAATVGIGIAWGLPMVSLGSGVLTLVNLLSINVVALAVFWYMEYRPENWFQADAARAKLLHRVAVLVVAILVLSAFLGAVTYTSYQGATFEQTAESQVRDVLSGEQYAGYELLSLSTDDNSVLFSFGGPTTVTATVGRAPNADPDTLAATLEDRLQNGSKRNVSVRIDYVQTSGPAASGATPATSDAQASVSPIRSGFPAPAMRGRTITLPDGAV